MEYDDIIPGLPVNDSSCKGIYSSHILEHLSLEDCRKALKNTYYLLRQGGTFRLVVPDLEALARNYLNDSSPDAALNFLSNTELGKEKRHRGLVKFFYEWQKTSNHLWMWDFKSMERELKNAGFVAIRQADFGDSTDPMFIDVENAARWENAIGISCKRGPSL